MGWKKGQSGNPNGRPPGARDKVNNALRESIKSLVEREFENIPALLTTLSPKDRAKFLLDLTKYVLPTLSSVSVDALVEGNIQTIEVRYKDDDLTE